MAFCDIFCDNIEYDVSTSVHADVVRVGALRRIDKRLLPYSLHAVDSRAHGDAIAELKDMLAASASAAEAAVIQKELDLAKQVLLGFCLPFTLTL